MTRAAPRRRGPGAVLFASAPREARARRPTDVALAIASFLALVVTTVLARVGADLDEGLRALLESEEPGRADGPGEPDDEERPGGRGDPPGGS